MRDKKRLPIGIAALTAFLVGWVGPIMGRYQVWWEEPVARKLRILVEFQDLYGHGTFVGYVSSSEIYRAEEDGTANICKTEQRPHPSIASSTASF